MYSTHKIDALSTAPHFPAGGLIIRSKQRLDAGTGLFRAIEDLVSTIEIQVPRIGVFGQASAGIEALLRPNNQFFQLGRRRYDTELVTHGLVL